jgi:pantoate--beta-alanine ligase
LLSITGACRRNELAAKDDARTAGADRIKGEARRVQTISRLDDLREAVGVLKTGGKTLALVPTMGALHAGHMALVREARARADHVAVSIFVNPRQFSPAEDLATYPRPLEADRALLEAEGADLLWMPTPEVMYPAGYATNVTVSGLDTVLCGAARPGHFDGVATVVSKLFNQVRPDLALFGEKDWQQLTILRRMARDLDLTHPSADRVLGVPTVREPDGLAMSSRNQYLSPEERTQAAGLNRAMRAAAARIAAGEPVAAALADLKAEVLASGFRAVDYADLRDAATLEDMATFDGHPARLLVAAHIGRARLIDNVAVG